MNVDFEQVSLDFVPLEKGNTIASLQVCNNVFTVITRRGQLYAIDLDKPERVNQCQLDLCLSGNESLGTNSNGEAVLTSWLSPNAIYLLIKTNFNKYHVVHIPSLSPIGSNTTENDPSHHVLRTLPQARGKIMHDIKLVQWFSVPDDDSKDGNFLATTVNNELFLISKVNQWFQPQSKQSCNVEMILSARSNIIDGIFINVDKQGNNTLLLVIGDSIMYWYLSIEILKKPLLTSSSWEKKWFHHPTEIEQFSKYKNNNYLKRRFHVNKITGQFVWITSTGIIHGNLFTNKDTNGKLNELNVILAMELTNILDYDTIRDVINMKYFVVLLLNESNNIVIINKLNNKIVFNGGIDTGVTTPVTNMILDETNNTLWLSSQLTVLEIIIKGQSHLLWELLCKQHDFQNALKLKDLLPWQIDLIHHQMGEFLISDNSTNSPNLSNDEDRFDEGARQLAMSNSLSISANILLIQGLTHISDTEKALILQTYLLTKLQLLVSRDSKSQFYQVQICLLTNWIVRNYVKQLNDIIFDNNKETQTNNDNKLTKLERQLLQFCQDHVSFLDFKTAYQIVSNYMKSNHLLIQIATLNNDWDFILKYWINKKNWYEALQIWNKLDMKSEKNQNLIYQYSTILLINSPELTVEKWIKLNNQIDPLKLIPAMLKFFTIYQNESGNKISIKQDDSKQNFALNYLQWYVKQFKPKDKIFYNTVLYMLISDNNNDEQLTIDFINEHTNKYDINFILRLGLKLKRIMISIHLMTKLELYENALNLAMENHFIEMTKDILKHIDDKILKKKLYIKFAEILLIETASNNNTNDDSRQSIKQTVRTIIKESDGLLEIKDLLPIFNDIVVVGDIKDEILSSLNNYNESMNDINKEIETSTNLKHIITKQMSTFNERFEMLQPSASCDFCRKLLTMRKFVVFPCNHCIHIDCLIKMIYNSNNLVLKKQIESLQKKILRNRKDQDLLKKLESLMTAKCCFCSDISINTIDNPMNITQNQLDKWTI